MRFIVGKNIIITNNIYEFKTTKNILIPINYDKHHTVYDLVFVSGNNNII